MQLRVSRGRKSLRCQGLRRARSRLSPDTANAILHLADHEQGTIRKAMTTPSFAFVAAETPEAREALQELERRYPTVPLAEAEVIVALGGDGFMLETLHTNLGRGVPIYGMNRGTVGFLLNEFGETDLPERLAGAEVVTLHPLRMTAETRDGSKTVALAINEVALFRESRQAAKIRIRIDGVTRLDELVCDGILIATPAGSTAYNLSAHGPILPLGSALLALTPISAFRPRRWRGAILPHTACVELEVMERDKRPVSATADYTEIRDVVRVTVSEDRNTSLTLLFDPEHDLEERIIKEQFTP